MIIDTHAHLDFPDYDTDLVDVLNNARSCGVESIINVGVDLKSSRNSLALKDRVNKMDGLPEMFASIGIHPNSASETDNSDFLKLKELLTGNNVVAIGETGLDYYRDHSSRVEQQDLFRKHIELAIESALPVIIHNREASDDCLDIISEYTQQNLRGVIHCFNGDKNYAKKFLDLGFYISFAGPITYPKASSLRETAAFVPTDRLLLETDCPFLAPQKKRGKRNEPSFLQFVIPLLAEIYTLSVDDIERVTTVNAKSLFSLGNETENGKLAYMIRDSVYINITNRCTNRCEFCERERSPYVKGHCLKLVKEPSVEELIDAVNEFSGYDEVVFCGFGEPTIRLDELKKVAAYLKEQGARVRLNTNGMGDLIHGRPICEELKGLVDKICISLNTNLSKQYDEMCKPQFGDKSYPALMSFIKSAKLAIPEVLVSVVDMPEVDVEACRKIADDMGVSFRLRKYNDTGYKND